MLWPESFTPAVSSGSLGGRRGGLGERGGVFAPTFPPLYPQVVHSLSTGLSTGRSGDLQVPARARRRPQLTRRTRQAPVRNDSKQPATSHAGQKVQPVKATAGALESPQHAHGRVRRDGARASRSVVLGTVVTKPAGAARLARGRQRADERDLERAGARRRIEHLKRHKVLEKLDDDPHRRAAVNHDAPAGGAARASARSRSSSRCVSRNCARQSGQMRSITDWRVSRCSRQASHW